MDDVPAKILLTTEGELGKYIKLENELAQEIDTGLEEIFEGHYGCVITEAEFDEFEIEEIDMVWK